MTMSKSALAKRVDELEQQSGGRLRLCWVGDEPADLKPSDNLIVVSWESEEES